MKLLRKITNLALATAIVWGFGTSPLSAQDAKPPAAPAAEKKEEAKAEPPKPTTEQRLTAIEA